MGHGRYPDNNIRWGGADGNSKVEFKSCVILGAGDEAEVLFLGKSSAAWPQRHSGPRGTRAESVVLWASALAGKRPLSALSPWLVTLASGLGAELEGSRLVRVD